jgi:hypothetical protein
MPNSNEIDNSQEYITQDYLCVKTIGKNEWNFFIPLSRENYDRIKQNLSSRASIYNGLTDIQLFNLEGIPLYEDKSNIMMKKYLKYKTKYLGLKKKLINN